MTILVVDYKTAIGDLNQMTLTELTTWATMIGDYNKERASS